jgi:hypothetical protein
VDPSPLAWDKGGGFAKARAMELVYAMLTDRLTVKLLTHISQCSASMALSPPQ